MNSDVHERAKNGDARFLPLGHRRMSLFGLRIPELNPPRAKKTPAPAFEASEFTLCQDPNRPRTDDDKEQGEDIQKPEGWGFHDDSPDFTNGCLEKMELERELMDATAPELYALEDIQKPEGWGFLEGHDLGVHPRPTPGPLAFSVNEEDGTSASPLEFRAMEHEAVHMQRSNASMSCGCTNALACGLHSAPPWQHYQRLPLSGAQSSTSGDAAAVSTSTTAASNSSLPGAELVSTSSLPGAELVSNSSLPGAELVSNSSLPGAELVSESDLRMLADAQAAGDAFAEQRRMIEDLVNDPVVFGGLVALQVEHNRYSLPGSPMYERFVATRAGKPPPPLRIVFHGTDDENIEPILANGMDPSRRGMHGQHYGPGEYFATRALTSVRFALRGARDWASTPRLLVFLVSEQEVQPRAPDIVVVNDVSRELPLGTVTFQMVGADVMALDEMARQAKAAAERAKERAKAAAWKAMQKARIMQGLIRGDLYEASEMYAAVMQSSEREGEAFQSSKQKAFQSSVPRWAHELRFYLQDVERECVVALFPGVIPVRHDSITGIFRDDVSFKWPPTAWDMSQSESSPSAGKRRLDDSDDTGRDDNDADVLKEQAAKLEAVAVDAEARAQAARAHAANADWRTLASGGGLGGGLGGIMGGGLGGGLGGAMGINPWAMHAPLAMIRGPRPANCLDGCVNPAAGLHHRICPNRGIHSTVPLHTQVPPSHPQVPPSHPQVPPSHPQVPLHTQVPIGRHVVSRSSEGHQASSGVIGRHQASSGVSRSSEGHQASSGVIGRHQASSGVSRSSDEALRRAQGGRHAPRSTVVAVMKELKRFHQGSRGGSGRCVERDATDGTADDADADDDFRALLLDDADVLRWRVEMRLPPDSLLGAQLAAHAARWGGGAVVELEVLFGDDFPASPPFVRVVSPRFAFHTGHVTVGGSICMQLLTTSGWDSSFTVEATLVMVRDAMLSGHGALDSSRAHVPYSEAEARHAFRRVAQQHGWV